MAVRYRQGSTCGLSVDGWDAWDLGGGSHVEVRFTDASRACETVCDMTASATVLLAVPSPTTACGEVGGGCGADFR